MATPLGWPAHRRLSRDAPTARGWTPIVVALARVIRKRLEPIVVALARAIRKLQRRQGKLTLGSGWTERVRRASCCPRWTRIGVPAHRTTSPQCAPLRRTPPPRDAAVRIRALSCTYPFQPSSDT
eukprot:5092419-Prymnesium_polylepis.1